MPEEIVLVGSLPLFRSVWQVPQPMIDCDDSLAPGVPYLIVRWHNAHPHLEGIQLKFPLKVVEDEFDAWMDVIRCLEVIYLGPAGECTCPKEAPLAATLGPRETVVVVRHREDWNLTMAARVIALRETDHGFITPLPYRPVAPSVH